MWSMRSKLTNFLREYAPEFMNMCFDYKRDRPHTYDRTNEERRCQV